MLGGSGDANGSSGRCDPAVLNTFDPVGMVDIGVVLEDMGVSYGAEMVGAGDWVGRESCPEPSMTACDVADITTFVDLSA